MQKAPQIGSRIQVTKDHRYFPCTGTVTKIWINRICLNDDELHADDSAEPRYGGPAPEADWQVSMKVDALPKHWAYGPDCDVFCPDVSEVELIP